MDGITLRLFQNELRDLEQRIAAPSHLDLARERFDAVLAGRKRDGNFRQRRRRFGTLAAFAPVIATVVAARKSRLAIAKLGTTATLATADAVTARGAAFTGLVIETALGLGAFVAGEPVKTIG